jgi:hypothetical protein
VAAPALRPLGIGEILDVAIKITLRNWKTLIGLVALIVAPIQAVVALIGLSLLDEETFSSVESETFDSADAGTFFAGIGLIVVLSGLSWLLSTAVAFRAVVEAYLGRRSSWRSSLGFVARRLHSLLWLTIVQGVLLVLGFVACVIPGIWLWVSWSVAIPVLFTEDVRGSKALGRSFRLVRGRWWPTFGLVLLGFLLTSIVGAVIQGIFSALVFVADSDFAVFLTDTLGGSISSILTTPFLAAVITVLYVDLRVRKEGFDLQLLAERLGSPVDDDAEGQPLLLPPLQAPPPQPRPGREGAGDQPPYWPPPPGWKPSGGDSSDRS